MSTKYIASNWRLPNQAGVDSYLNDNYGLTFDGSEFIDVGNISHLSNVSKFTICYWFNLDSLSDFKRFLGSYTDTSNWITFNFKNSTGDLQFVVRNSDSSKATLEVVSSGKVEVNNWYNITVVYDGTITGNENRLKVFLNNTQETLTFTGTIPATTATLSNSFFINNDGFATGGSSKISEVAVFDYALSSTQISTLYGSSSLGAGNPMALKPAPVAYYPLGDNSSGNPLTQPNEAVEDASVFNFDAASSGYIETSSVLPLQSVSSFSISMWVNWNGHSAGSDQWMFMHANSGNTKRIQLEIFSSDLFFQITGTGGGFARVDMPQGEWVNLLCVFNSGEIDADKMIVYINGERASNVVYSAPTMTTTETDYTYSMIGARNDGFCFDGKMSNIAIWNSDQSSEISNIYNSGVPATTYTNTPTAWYKLDQSANWEADSSGAWQIPDAVSAYPQSFDFEPSETITTANPFTSIVTGSNVIGICTISYWLKVAGGSHESFMELVNSATHTAGFRIDNNNKPYYINSQGGRYKRFAALSNPSGWNHWCWIFPSNTSYADAKLYINGVEKSVDFDFSAAPANNAWNGFYINKFQTGSSATFKMSNLQLWSGNLTEPQITELYNNGVPLTTAIATDNLKAWYKLDNTATWTGSAFSVPDASGNGNTGTSSGMTEQNLVNNNVSALNGESSGMTSANLVLTDLTRNLPYDSYSFNFDAPSSEYIDCGTGLGDALGLYTGNISLSIWFKTDTVNPANDGIFYIGDFSSQGALQINIFNNNISFRANGALGNKQFSFTDITNWHHLACIYLAGDITNSKIYLDGVEQSTTNSGSFPSSLSLTGLKTIIGAYFSSSFTFDGKINNVSIFDEALTSTEVMMLYSNGMPQDLSTFTPAPVAWYTLGSNSFFNGSNFICKDLIGSNNGTSVNAGVDALQGNTPRSEANGTGTNNSIPENLVGTTKYSSNNSWSINMSESARVADTP